MNTTLLITLLSTLILTSCTNETIPALNQSIATATGPSISSPSVTEPNSQQVQLNVQVGNEDFTATLTDNPSSQALVEMLPLTLSMDDMNANEKFYFLDSNLPTASQRPNEIINGDLMLYGSNCLVMFYETFSPSYSYTRLGSIDNPNGLKEALGQGNVTVTFSLKE